MQSVFAYMQDRLKFETGRLRFRRHIASDAQRTLEIPATDEIHMEDRNHGLA